MNKSASHEHCKNRHTQREPHKHLRCLSGEAFVQQKEVEVWWHSVLIGTYWAEELETYEAARICEAGYLKTGCCL